MRAQLYPCLVTAQDKALRSVLPGWPDHPKLGDDLDDEIKDRSNFSSAPMPSRK